jgi:MFS family permease
MGPLHWRVLALVAAGYFFDVLDFTIFGALVPDLIRSGFVTQQQVPWIGSITLLGLFIGTLGQGEFTDRFGRKTVYQFNLLLFGVATIVSFGLAQAAGRIGAAVAIPSILWIYTGFGLNVVFAMIAVMVAIAAIAVTRIGPEARGLALDEIAPPTE